MSFGARGDFEAVNFPVRFTGCCHESCAVLDSNLNDSLENRAKKGEM